MKPFTPTPSATRFAIIDDLLSAKPKGTLGRSPHGPPRVERKEVWCDRYNKYRDKYVNVTDECELWGYTFEQLHDLGFVTASDAVEWHATELERRKGKRTSYKAQVRRENRLNDRVYNRVRYLRNYQHRHEDVVGGLYEIAHGYRTIAYMPANGIAEAEQLASTMLVGPLGLESDRIRISWETYHTQANSERLQQSISGDYYDRSIQSEIERHEQKLASLRTEQQQASLALAMTMGILDTDDEDVA